MKKKLLKAAVLLIFAGTIPAAAESMVTGNFGVNLFGYDTTYLTTGVMYQKSVQTGMDMVFGADFGIHTEKNASNEVEADFLIPLRLGLHFPFKQKRVTYGFGTGITPTFQLEQSEDSAGFLMGPYVNGSVRIQVHPVMSVFLQYQQDLLFGEPEWIYTGSRFLVGISF
ncbi:MAG: hypothetical protein K9L66_12765 [Spirochaetaceae bacterium]|nr:hypothetical protein [Spirochaetaceae bacterium]MCF7949266.1 hypothetical protein [Spirochaetia bacterium]MCF7952328.1 hypothetical protein [Spirochaetaceae bacterium]